MLNLLLKPWIATCGETRDRISDYLDGELEGRKLTRVQRHLARCHRCQAMLESLSKTLERLRSLGSSEPASPGPSAVSAVLARIRSDER